MKIILAALVLSGCAPPHPYRACVVAHQEYVTEPYTETVLNPSTMQQETHMSLHQVWRATCDSTALIHSHNRQEFPHSRKKA